MVDNRIGVTEPDLAVFNAIIALREAKTGGRPTQWVMFNEVLNDWIDMKGLGSLRARILKKFATPEVLPTVQSMTDRLEEP